MFIRAAVERLATLLLNKCVGPVGRHEVAWAGNPSWWQALTTEMNTKYEIIILISSLTSSITTVILIIRLRFILVYWSMYLGIKNIVIESFTHRLMVKWISSSPHLARASLGTRSSAGRPNRYAAELPRLETNRAPSTVLHVRYSFCRPAT